MELCPKTTRKGQALPKIHDPYRDTLDDIKDEPGFDSALKEIEKMEGANSSERSGMESEGSDYGQGSPELENEWVRIIHL